MEYYLIWRSYVLFGLVRNITHYTRITFVCGPSDLGQTFQPLAHHFEDIPSRGKKLVVMFKTTIFTLEMFAILIKIITVYSCDTGGFFLM